MFRPSPRRPLGAAFALAVAALTLTPIAAVAQPAGLPLDQIVESSEVPDGVNSDGTPTAERPAGAGLAGAEVTGTGVAGAMTAGQSLTTRQTLKSPGGTYALTLGDGSLKVTRGSVTTFRSLQADYSRNTTGDVMRLQGDGNLVVYRADGMPLWHTGTNGQGPVQLRLQDDGNLVLYNTSTWKPLWNSGILSDVTRLSAGTLHSGMSLYSPDGVRRFAMQGDGNLVLYRGTQPMWNSRTFVPGSRLVVHGGTATVMSPGNRVLWSTPEGRDATLLMQGDGNTVVYAPGPVWHTNTAMPNCNGVTGPVDQSQVVRAANGTVIHPCLVPAFNRMVADAAGQGVNLRGSGWRDMNVQIRLRVANCGGDTPYNVWEKPSGQCTPPTAIPGRSMHERGLAIDFSTGGRSIGKTSPQFVWLSENAAHYGLKNLPSEPWHWSTNGH